MKPASFLRPFLITFLLPLPSYILPQVILQGIVTEADSKKPLVGASVYIPQTGQGTTTDLQGFFQFTIGEELPLSLEIQHIGHVKKTLLVSSPDQVHRIELAISPLLLDQVIVSASRQREEIGDAPAAVSVIESPQIQADAVTSPVLALRSLSGVTIEEQGIGRYQIGIRGRMPPIEGGEVHVLIDDQQLVRPGLVFTPFSTAPIDAIDLASIEVLHGPASALYGPGVDGGIVHFRSKDAFQYPGTAVSILAGNQSTWGGSVRHAGIIRKKLGYKFLGIFNQARNWPLDPEVPNFQVLQQFVNEDEVEKLSVSGALDYRLNESSHLVATGGYGFYTGRGGQPATIYKDERLPFYRGQLKFDSPRFFSQVYFTRLSEDDPESNLPATQIDAQFQYRSPTLFQQLDLTAGGDYRLTTTQGNDDFVIFGAYAQANWTISRRFRAVASARVDRFAVAEQTRLAPRLALLYQPTSNHTFRLTYNRAYGLMGALENFFDFVAASTPLFDVRVWGMTKLLEYDEPPVMISYFGLPPSDQFGIPLAAAYPIVLSNLSKENGLSKETTDYLGSLSAQVSGFSEGVMTLNGRRATDFFQRSEAAKTTRTDQIELGYQGVLGDKWSLQFNLYFNQKQDFLSLLRVNPVVNVPTLGSDLAAVITPLIDADKLPAGVSPEQVALELVAAGNALGNSPLGVGVIEPIDARENGRPDLLLTFLNFGKANYWGMETAVKYHFSNELSAYANYTRISKTVFDEQDLNETGTGLEYTLNQPRNRLRLGINYLPEKGWHGNVALRYNEGYLVNSGIFSGTLPSYIVLDAGMGYRFPFGLRIDMTATNLLDEKYRSFPQMPYIRRLVLTKATYEF